MANTATISEYTISGMSCQHCVAAVTEEVGAIDGVTDVHVDLATGLLRVTSAIPLDDSAVRAAVDEAGYEVAGET
ncbi:MAG: heavy-metal-associated domain-containing protein [Pseudonocardiales bacterium]